MLSCPRLVFLLTPVTPAFIVLSSSDVSFNGNIVRFLEFISGTSEIWPCSFPQFIWQVSPTIINRKWYGRTEYFQNTDFWRHHTEILAKESEILIREKVYAPCDHDIIQNEDTIPCYREDIVMNYICLAEEANGKFRLRQDIKG